MQRRIKWQLLLLQLAAACASAPSSHDPTAFRDNAVGAQSDRRQFRAVRSAELIATEETNAGDAIAKIRPDFLRGRSIVGFQPSEVAVYVDDVYLGDVSVLRLIPLNPIIEIRFESSSEAFARFGLMCHCNGGAIFVTTRKR